MDNGLLDMLSRLFLGKKRIRDQMIRNVVLQICAVFNRVPGFMPDSLASNEYFIGYIMGVGKMIGQVSGYSKPIERIDISRMVMVGVFGTAINATEVLVKALQTNKEERVLEMAVEHAGLDFSEFFVQIELDRKSGKPFELIELGLPRLREQMHTVI